MTANVHFSMLVLGHVIYLQQKVIGQFIRTYSAFWELSRILCTFSVIFNIPFAIAMRHRLF